MSKNIFATTLLAVLFILTLGMASVSDVGSIRFPTLAFVISPVNLRITHLVLAVRPDSDTDEEADLLVVFESSSEHATLYVDTEVIAASTPHSYVTMEPRYEPLYYAKPENILNKTVVYQPETYEPVKYRRETALGYWGSGELPVVTSYRFLLGENIRNTQKTYSRREIGGSVDDLVITGRVEFKVTMNGIVRLEVIPYLRSLFFADIKLSVSDISSSSESSFELEIPEGTTVSQFSSNLISLRPNCFWTSLSLSGSGKIEERFYVQYEKVNLLLETPFKETLYLVIGLLIKPTFDMVRRGIKRH